MSREINIRTERLSLRPLRPADGEHVVRLLDDYEVARWLTVVPHPYTLTDFNGFLAHLADTSPLGGLAIEEAGQVLGVVGLDPTLGYWLGRAHQGRGVMGEAASALVNWAFQQQDIDQIGSGYFEGNVASKSVLHRLGFRDTGVVEDVNCVSQGIEVKLVKAELTRDMWAASR